MLTCRLAWSSILAAWSKSGVAQLTWRNLCKSTSQFFIYDRVDLLFKVP